MTRISEKAMAAAAALSAVAAVVAALVGGRTGLLAFAALLPLAIFSLLLSLFSWGRLRLQRLAAEEQRDAALARTERPDSALFEGGETDPFSLGRTARQFETFVVPAFPVLLALGFGLWAWQLYHHWPLALATPREPLFACAFLAGLAFLLFLLSRYLLGLARDPAQRLVRAPGIAIGLTSLGAFAGALAAVAVQVGLRGADRVLAYALTGVLALLAVENLCFFLVSLYAPGRGRRQNVAYESRLGAFVTDPATWARDLAQSFDYQFGTRTAESTSYRFLRGAVVPLLLFQLGTLYFMSSLVFLGPEEEGILERFGRPHPTRWHLTSGFCLKAPWPFETVRRVPARRVLTAHVGFEGDDAGPRRDTLLWTIPHYKNEESFVTASRPSAGTAASVADATSVGLISFNLPVEYRITNVYAYVYRHQDPPGLLRDLAYRALTREVAARDLVDLLGQHRLEISGPIQARLQSDADALGLGVEILFVGLQGVHPPVAVAEAFQSVVGALEEREASILAARAYTNSVLPVAAANADRIRFEGEANRVRRATTSQAEAQLFDQRLIAYRRAPAVFTSGLYLSTLRDALSGVRKYIVDHRNAREVLYFDFKEKPFPDLFELGPAPADGEHP
jgi:membrane protease subunit HflK